MRKFSTNLLTKVLPLFVAVLCVGTMSAQYTITTGGNSYPLTISDLGQFSGDPLTATVMVGDGNCAPTNGAGGILILDNDVACDPAVAVDNAAANGPVSVIVCNVVDGNGTLFFPYQTDVDGNVIAGTNANDPEIAVFTMAQADCDEVKVNMGADATIELLVPECMRDIPDNAVWGLNGEGEFDGSLNGWTIDNDNGFKYSPRGKLDQGAYNSNVNQIVSPTLCNGAVVADASFGDNGGVPGDFLSGNCPSDGTIFCDTRLTSPVIDLSGIQTDGIFLQFFQALRQFNSEYYILVSVDGGATFRDTISINETIPTNSNHIQENITVPLCGVDGEDDLVIRFWYRGYYYYWGIDDVFLLNQGSSDIRINTNFVAQAPNYRTPETQSDIIALLADIENIGNGPSNETMLSAELFDETAGAVIDAASLDYGDVAGCFLDQNRLFPDLFSIPPSVGPYRLVYTLGAVNDEDVSNNSATLNFEVTETVFSKCDPNDATASIAFPDQPFFSLGNAYYVTNAEDENGNQLYIEQLRIGIDDSPTNVVAGAVDVSIYEWNDMNNNQDVDADDGTGVPERTLVYETSLLIFEANQGYDDYIIELGDDRVALKDNQNYLVVLHGRPNTASTDQYRFLAADSEANIDYYFGATALAFGPESPTGDGVGGVLGNPLNMTRLGSVGGVGDSADDADTRRLFQVNNFSAFAEMHITMKMPSNSEELNENIQVSVFPNPAVSDVFVDLALENVSENVNIEIVDIKGSVVLAQDFANVKADKLQLNVENLTTGVYVVNIRTEEGFTSTRFVKD